MPTKNQVALNLENETKTDIIEKIELEISNINKFRFIIYHLLINIATYLNKKRHQGITSIFQLIRFLDASFAETMVAKLKPEYICSWVMFFFLKALFNLTDEQLLAFLHRDPKWAQAIGFNLRYKQKSRVSEARNQIGRENIDHAIALLFNQAFELVTVNQVSEEAILEYSVRVTYLKRKSYVNLTGFDVFFQFLTNFGLIAELINCSDKDDSNSQYTKQDIVYILVKKLVFNAKTITELSKAHKNDVHQSDKIFITPTRITLSDEIKQWDADKLEALSIRLMNRIRRLCGHSKTLIGIDSSILEVYGNYEQADKVYDHHTNKKIKAYKLFIALDLNRKQIVAFKLTSGKVNDATQLLDLAAKINANIGQHHVEMIMFDRGFYKAQSFAKINRNKTDFITPAKKFDDVKQAIAAMDNYKPYGDNEQIADKWIYVTGYGKIRIIIIKKTVIKYRAVKNDKGTRYLLDSNGNRIRQPYEETVFHPYFTNIPQKRKSASEIIELYSKRWKVENFFDELKHQWWIKYFPATDFNTVRSYTYFTLILYQSLGLFKTIFLRGKFKNCQLITIRTEFFNVIVALYMNRLFGQQLALSFSIELIAVSQSNRTSAQKIKTQVLNQLAEMTAS